MIRMPLFYHKQIGLIGNILGHICIGESCGIPKNELNAMMETYYSFNSIARMAF